MTQVTLQFKKARNTLPAIDDTVIAKGVLEMVPTASGAGQPVEIVFVIDRSGSMIGEKIQAVKSALDRLSSQLSPQSKVGVVVYNSDAQIVVPLVDARTYPQYLRDIRGIDAWGLTASRHGLRLAVEMLEDNGVDNAIKVIVLLTDGQELEDGHQTEADTIMAEQQSAEVIRNSGIHIVPVVIDQEVTQRFVDTLIAAGPAPDKPIVTPQAAITANEIELILIGLYKKLRSRIGTNLHVRLTPSPLTAVQSVYQVAPNLRAVQFHADGEDWLLEINDDLFADGMTIYIAAEYEAEDGAIGSQPFIEELVLTWDNVATGQTETANLGAVELEFVQPGQEDREDDPAMKDLIRTVLIQQKIDAGLIAARTGDVNASIAAFDAAASIAGSNRAHSDLASLARQLGKQAQSGSLSAQTAGASIARNSMAAQNALKNLN